MKANYHTHTTRCQHAKGSDEDYVLSAIKAGYDELGFSDHAPWKYNSDFHPTMRMELSQFEDYKKSILSLKEKYKDQISIKLGLEVEYYEQYMPWMKQFIKDQELDYVIFGNHFYETDENRFYYGSHIIDNQTMELYLNDAIKGMETGLYAYFAHPDLFMRSLRQWDALCDYAAHVICDKAKELDFILEYNIAGKMVSEQLGREQYPHHRFWEIAADTGCKAIVGIDAHDNLNLEKNEYYDNARAYLKSLGLNVVDTIKFLR